MRYTPAFISDNKGSLPKDSYSVASVATNDKELTFTEEIKTRRNNQKQINEAVKLPNLTVDN